MVAVSRRRHHQCHSPPGGEALAYHDSGGRLINHLGMFIDGRGKPTRARRPEAERDAAAEVAQAKRWKRGIGKKEEREKGKEAGEVGKRKGWREKKVVGPGTPRTGSRSGTTPEAG